MIEELARHGYKLSAGTLYPILHGMEERGLLASKEEYSGRVRRRILRWTAETGQVAKRASPLGTAIRPEVRHDQHAEAARR
jgi:DNA-binding PadR family transcriptional regulator